MQNPELFFKNDFIGLINRIPENYTPLWGKMNTQQMIEHLSDMGFKIASGKIILTETLPADIVEKSKAFLASDKMFRENTKHPLLSEDTYPIKHPEIYTSIEALQQDMNDFFLYFENNPNGTTRNYVFGDLDYNENLRLLYKHCVHHLKQFGIEI